MQNKDRDICSGPSGKAKLTTTRSINSIFFSFPHKKASQNPARFLLVLVGHIPSEEHLEDVKNAWLQRETSYWANAVP